MIAWKKLVAMNLVGITLTLNCAAACALSVGEGGSLPDMQAKLAAEQQVEVMTATTGDVSNLRGLKFFSNLKTRIAYVGMTDNPIKPTKMKIVATTSGTQNGAPSIVPPAIQSIRDCQRLISQGMVEKSNCGSLESTLETAKETGKSIVQYGVMPDGNFLFAAINLKSGEGTLYEVTPSGATVAKLPFASGKLR